MSEQSDTGSGSAADRLWRLWRQGGRPDLDSFLAAVGPLGPMELAAILRVDQAEGWATASPILAEDYLRRYPAVGADPVAVVDLIHNEYLLAERAGRPVDAEAFIGRFPGHANTLRLQIDFHRAMLPPTYSAVHHQSPGEETTISRAEATGTVPPGAKFGEYELLSMIARGGMGVVYKARQPKLDRIVALKMILAGHFASDGAVERFRAEAQAAARLEHPGIVPVFEIGELRGLHYFTMAFVEGQSLAEVLRDGPVPAARAAHIIRELCSAVEYAHVRGIVHRDLKPANVMIDRDGKSKLTDFGLAKRTYDTNEQTGTGEILGTPAYMSPEQALGGGSDVGPLSDVYGLGALLFALLTGRPPFQAATAMETMRHVIYADPPRPRLLNPSIPRDLETICRKSLAKIPAKRYASATAMAADLDRFLEGRPILARPVGAVEKAYRWYRRRPVIGTMAAALIVLLAAVPILLASLWGEAEARARVESAGRVKTEVAERDRTIDLFRSFVKEAAALRSSPKVGKRFQTLDRIIAARDLAESLDLPATEYTQLRSEAISALSLVDVRATSIGTGWGPINDPTSLRYLEVNDLYLTWDATSAVLVRRAADDRIAHRIRVDHTNALDEVQLSANNRFLLSRDGKRLVVWQIDGTNPKEILRRTDVLKAWFAPDLPEIVVFTHNWDLQIVPLGEGMSKTIHVLEHVKGPIYLQQSTLGPRHQLVIPRLKNVFVFDLDLLQETFTIPVPNYPDDIVWSPNGETLAISNRDSGVILYRLRDKFQQVMKAPLGGPVHVAFDPDGRFALFTCPWTGHNVLVDVPLGRPELQFHSTELESNAETLDSTRGDRLKVTRDSTHRILPLRPEDGLATFESLAVHPGGRLLATPTTMGIVLTDLLTGQRLGLVPAPGECGGARFDEAGNLFAVQKQGRFQPRIQRWEIKVDGNVFSIGAAKALGTPNAGGIDISADGRYVAEGIFTGALVYDRQTGQGTVPWIEEDIRQVAIHPDGSLLAAFPWGPKGFHLWDVKSGKKILRHPTGNLGRGRFTPDGKHLITFGSGESDLLAWSIPDCKLAQKLGPVGVFAISPDSRYVAVTEPNGKIRINRMADGEQIARFDAPGQDYLLDLAYSPDGRYLVGMNTERTQHHVWDLWKLRRQLRELKLDWEDDPPPNDKGPVVPISIKITSPSWWGPIVGPLPLRK